MSSTLLLIGCHGVASCVHPGTHNHTHTHKHTLSVVSLADTQVSTEGHAERKKPWHTFGERYYGRDGDDDEEVPILLDYQSSYWLLSCIIVLLLVSRGFALLKYYSYPRHAIDQSGSMKLWYNMQYMQTPHLDASSLPQQAAPWGRSEPRGSMYPCGLWEGPVI